MEGSVSPSCPPLLVSVERVCASHAACAPLEHVARLIDSFLDPSPQLSLEKAVTIGSVRLFARVLFHHWQHRNDGSVDVFLQQLRLRRAMQQAAMRGEMAMMERIHVYHPQFLAANALTRSAKRGDFEMIQWLETHRHDESTASIPDALITAAEHGHLEVVRYLMESYNHGTPATVYCPSEALQASIENGHVDVATYLSNRGVRSDFRGAGNMAARHGHLSAVQWLHVADAPQAFTSEAMTAAAGAGHLGIVRFLHDNRTEGCRSRAMDSAASGGFLDVVQFLYSNRHEGCTERAVIFAAAKGYLSVLEWMYTHYPRTMGRAIAQMTVAALAHDHRHVLAWLQSECGPTPKLPAYAAVEIANAGSLAGLKTLHALHGASIQWSPRVMEIAATSGDIAMLQWLHEHRPASRSAEAINKAAASGQLEAVQWLHAHGMACTPLTLASAAASGDLAMVQWVDAHCAESNVQAAMDMAATDGHVAIVQWLHDHHQSDGCTVDAMDRAAMNGHLEMVIWLQTNRTEGCTTSALDAAAEAGHWELVQWLVRNRSEGATQQGINDAVAHGHVRIAELLQHQYGLHVAVFAVMHAIRVGLLNVVQWVWHRSEQHQEDEEEEEEEQLVPRLNLMRCREQAAIHGEFHIVDLIDDHTRAMIHDGND